MPSIPNTAFQRPRSEKLLVVLALLLLPAAAAADEKKPLTFSDLMRFNAIEDPVISDDGSWIAYELRPDRGDGEVVARSADGERSTRIALGRSPALTPDGSWVAARVVPTLEATEAADPDDPDAAPQDGLALASTSSATRVEYERVKAFAFSADGRWLAVHHLEEPAAEEEATATDCEPKEPAVEPETSGEEEEIVEGETEAGELQPEIAEEGPGEEEEDKDERLGTVLRLRHLDSGQELLLENVESFAPAETSDFLAYAVAAAGGENGLFVLPLGKELPKLEDAQEVTSDAAGRYTALAWAEEAPRLAFVAAVDDEDGEAGDGTVWLFDGTDGRAIVTGDQAPEGWTVPSVNQLTWSRDGERLFFGFKPAPEPETGEDRDAGDGEDKDDEDEPFDPYDFEAILADTEVDVWHVDDPLIKTNERGQWEEEKDRTFLAVFHLDGNRVTALADGEIRLVEPSHAPNGILAMADVPYFRERTWEGFFFDLYWISLRTGEKHLLAEKVGSSAQKLSPDGRSAAWYENGDWHLWNSATKKTRNLTAGLDVTFADELHDYPSRVPGYDSPGWLADGSAFLAYDRWDLWKFPVDGEPVNLTGGRGREEHTQFRLWDLDPKLDAVPAEGPWLVEGYRDRTKNDSLWHLHSDRLEKIHEADKRFALVTVAEDAERLLVTRQSYREFPDLWITDTGFENPRKLSDANPQVDDYAWGHAELVNFTNTDGVPLDGILIRPETLDEGERCPVLVYYYRFFSQRLHFFNEPKVNHRPSFPVYASHGYCVFLPDVRFEVGRPGLSAVKALVPGVQKIVDMGVADPEALGLHGHSWSGYQTAFAVTQTHIFAAAVAGAPVSNMTSAYGGIRYGTGLARQFQYEQSQSRLGKSLWEGRDLYIENSPLFYADRIETPLLLQFGDVDEAVPWTQGIELYLALRRLGKDAVFLQYRDEPHHLKKYANKLDYSIKMKEYFDHYLKGAEAPAWMTEGVPYKGDK